MKLKKHKAVIYGHPLKDIDEAISYAIELEKKIQEKNKPKDIESKDSKPTKQVLKEETK